MLNFQTAKIVIIIKLSVKTLYFVWYITLAYANKKIRLDKFSKAQTNTFQLEMVKTSLTLRKIPNLKNVNNYTGDPRVTRIRAHPRVAPPVETLRIL